MTIHEIDQLIERYLDGATTPAEERVLALAVQREDAPPEWAIIAEMLGELTTDAALYDALMAQRTPKPAPRIIKLWPWAAAACIALAVGLFYNHMRLDAPQEIAHAEPQLPPKMKHEAPASAPSAAPSSAPSEAFSAPSAPTPEPPFLERPLEATNGAPEPPTEAPLLASAPTNEPPFLERPLEASNEAPSAPEDARDARLYLALLAEVEARALQAEQPELHLYRAIFDEIFVNIEQQSNRPELSL